MSNKDHTNAYKVIDTLMAYASPQRAETNAWFFKTGPGEYGEGDVFVGVAVPSIRKVAKMYRHLDTQSMSRLTQDPVHEVRLLGYLIAVYKYEKADADEQTAIVQWYLSHKDGINNWDLVDITTPKILGAYYLARPQQEWKLFVDLAQSDRHWDRRMAMLAMHPFIKAGKLEYPFKIANLLLGDQEDLMHKAVGWMLREMWKVDAPQTEQFLRDHYDDLARTTLRYAIERMDEPKRKRYLAKDF